MSESIHEDVLAVIQFSEHTSSFFESNLPDKYYTHAKECLICKSAIVELEERSKKSEKEHQEYLAKQELLPKLVLKAFGFWYSDSTPNYIKPQHIVSPSTNAKQSEIDYLTRGIEIGSYMGYSYCRFKCNIEDTVVGSREFSDGVWVWPEGLPHYLEKHNVLLPIEFSKHIESNKTDDINFSNFNVSYNFEHCLS